MSPKSLELQKLQHRGIERLRHAVDLVKKKDSPVMPRFLAVIVIDAMISLIVYSLTSNSSSP